MSCVAMAGGVVGAFRNSDAFVAAPQPIAPFRNSMRNLSKNPIP
jgi:hypothetical protein